MIERVVAIVLLGGMLRGGVAASSLRVPCAARPMLSPLRGAPAHVHLFAYWDSRRSLALVAHFAAHYARVVGVDMQRNARVVVRNGSASSVRATCDALRLHCDCACVVSEDAVFSEQRGADLASAYVRSLPVEAWLLHPELEELFALPCNLTVVVANKSVLISKPVDRAARDWTLARVAPVPARPLEGAEAEGALAEQFPRMCALSDSLFKLHSTPGKLVLFPVRDAQGRPLAVHHARLASCQNYRSHDPSQRRRRLGDAAALHGCEFGAVLRGPPFTRYALTSDAEPSMREKLAIYKGVRALAELPAVSLVVARLERQLAALEWCDASQAFRLTADARRTIQEKALCDANTLHLELADCTGGEHDNVTHAPTAAAATTDNAATTTTTATPQTTKRSFSGCDDQEGRARPPESRPRSRLPALLTAAFCVGAALAAFAARQTSSSLALGSQLFLTDV